MSGKHPYRKQAQAINIPEHLLPQIYMNGDDLAPYDPQSQLSLMPYSQQKHHQLHQKPQNNQHSNGIPDQQAPTPGRQAPVPGPQAPAQQRKAPQPPQIQTRRSSNSRVPQLQSPLLLYYQEKSSPQNSAAPQFPNQPRQPQLPSQSQGPHPNFNSNVNTPSNASAPGPGFASPPYPVNGNSRQNSPYNSRNASNLSLNQRKPTNSSQESFIYPNQRVNSNGFQQMHPQQQQPMPPAQQQHYPTYPPQQQQQQLQQLQPMYQSQYQPQQPMSSPTSGTPPLNYKPVRKAPTTSAGVPPIQTHYNENRRIASSPNVPHSSHFDPQSSPQHQMSPVSQYGGPKYDLRAKSLSSMSRQPQYQNQTRPSGAANLNAAQSTMEPIQQGQMMSNNISNNNPGYGYKSTAVTPSNSSASSVHHSFSLSSKSRSFTSLSKLSSLSTKKFNSSASLQGKNFDRNVSSGTISSQKTLVQMSRKPSVYPAMLSRVSRVFRESIFLTINTKDGLEYHDTFTGKMAVDIICRIIRTNDRNLALLLGRALDSQKLFHDVTYNHRLRDSVHEVYAFSHIYTDVQLYDENNQNNHSSSTTNIMGQSQLDFQQQPYPPHLTNGLPSSTSIMSEGYGAQQQQQQDEQNSSTGVNGVFTILTDCYSPTCSRNKLCYSIACPRRLEQQARLNLKPQGGLKRAVSRLSLHDLDETKSLWHETVPKSVLDKLDKHEKMRQELIYEFIYTERDYVKDLEFMTDFYILPLRNPSNNIIPEREREAFIRTVFGGVSDLLRLAKSMSEALTRRQQQQKPVVETFADVFLQFVDKFDPFIKYSGNKVFASFEHERQQQVNMRYASFLEAIEKRPESRKQDLSSFLIKGIQRPARYQLLLGGILKNTKPESPDYKNLVKAKEEIEKILTRINIQTGESTDRHKIMVLHRLLGKQTLEDKYNFKLSYNNRIIYQVTLNRKRDNEKIDLYLFEHAVLFVKHKIQNKREQYKVYERPIYLPLLYVNSGYDIPSLKSVINSRVNGSIISDSKVKVDPSLNTKLQVNFLGLGSHQVHSTLSADDATNQNQVLSQISLQQRKLIEKYDIFSLSKYETRRFTGNNKINCAVPCYGGKKLLYGTDSGVWVSTVRTISITNNEKICSDPTMVISKLYVTQIEVLVEYSKLLILLEKSLYEFDLSCTDSLDHAKNTRSGKLILTHVTSFKTGISDGKLLVCAIKLGSTHSINIFEPSNPFDKANKNRNKKYDIREILFNSDPISISFLRTRLCIGCTKGFEILSLEEGKKEPILDEADPSLDFATQKEQVNPLAIHKLGKDFLLSYSEFSFLINRNGWRTKHYWGIFWEGNPTNIALFYPYLLSFESNFIEIRDLETCNLIRALVGENIRFLHSNEHEAMYVCEENGYDVIVSIDFLNLKPKPKP